MSVLTVCQVWRPPLAPGSASRSTATIVRLPTYSMAGSNVALLPAIAHVAERANPTQETEALAVVGRAGEKRARQVVAELPAVVPVLEGHVDVLGVFRVDEPVFGADRQVARHLGHVLHLETVVIDLPGLAVVGAA